MTNTLYSLSTSHPALAARAMLDHKGIDYRVAKLVPGFHPPLLRLRRFRGGTVPALAIDGRRVQGSREISRALDEIQPDPPLFPSDPEERRRVEEAERWGEEVLQNVPRRINRWILANEYEARRWLADDVSGVPLGGLIARPPFQAKAFAKASGATAETIQADIAGLRDTLDHVESLRGDGVIGGASPNAADFQIASSLRSLANVGDLQPYIADHPAIVWSATVVDDLPGPTPSGLPREWLAVLEREPA
jgi:glutathione S-transferase